MYWIVQNYNLIYIVLVGLLLSISWIFFRKSQFDERRKNRFSLQSINQYKAFFKTKFYNDNFEKELRKNGMPSWLTSERINLVRYGIIAFLIFITLLEILTKTQYISSGDLMLWAIIPIALTPKKPFPFFYVIRFVRSNYLNDVSNEVYQLYNEIKANFQIKGGGFYNSYYTVQQALPYYRKIRVTLEKMLPLLEKRKLDEAWKLFATELETKEAQMLAIVMKEVESLNDEQAFLLLDQKRQEFSNHLYNRYTEKLRRRKQIFFILVVIGAMTVFMNEITVFFMWYKDIMSISNQFN